MDYKTIGKFLIVDIHKALGVQSDYDFVRVRKDYFTKADKLHRNVLVRTPNGEKIFTPKDVKRLKTFDEIFLFPNNPMKMYELSIPHCEKKPTDYYEFR